LNPLERLNRYFSDMKARGDNTHICLTTLSPDGFPNSRFVDLKGITDWSLLFGTDQRSIKAQEFFAVNRVSGCLWWEAIGIQVRIKGSIRRASDELSDTIFADRNRVAKAIATLSIQSQELKSEETMKAAISEYLSDPRRHIERPPTWFVFEILPKEIEILEFKEDRFHVRTHFRSANNEWLMTKLSP